MQYQNSIHYQNEQQEDVNPFFSSNQLKKSIQILLKDIDEPLLALKNRALEHKQTLTIGRSHGIHAEPMPFGLKLASFYSEFERNKKRLENAHKEISTCAISGAIATFANIHQFVEK